jgi:ubiquinone/menaquinone biosynthesis C-methylase UbiE
LLGKQFPRPQQTAFGDNGEGIVDKRLKIALGVFGGLLVLVLLNVIGQARNTLDRLTIVERERDQWQRAPAVIRELNLHDGSSVVDLGCGAGYFALKLSTAVGATGTVQAVDILRLPLTFLWIRAVQRGTHNTRVVLGDPDDPHIPGPVDSVLIANTYHELAHPKVVLGRLHLALTAGGRLVIADRGPQSTNAEHAIDPALVEAELRRHGFDILSRDDHFLDQPGEGPWWLIVARKAPL